MLVMEANIFEFGESKTTLSIKNDTLRSINIEIARQGDYERPSFGIISKTGSVSFIDKNSVVKNNLQWLTTNKKFIIGIVLRNTKTNKTTGIATYTTTKWKYNANSNIVNVDFSDMLTEWQDRQVPALNADLNNPLSKDCATIYNYLRETLKYMVEIDGKIYFDYLYDLCSISDLDEKTQDVLNNTIIKYPILESGSLWENFDKLCQACGLHIYWDGFRTRCVYGL